MMFGKNSRKPIAATLLLVFATEVFAPSMTYALTSGPTQPEATSFEPIDTTDMINLQTGDFTYNIPLIEIPGPDGSYPLSLSYHAGIQPNVDASWVGLGWTLNPGAINRSVNGYPDDWGGVNTTVHNYWNGGSTTTYQVGISVGIANTPVTVGFGLSFSHDTYRGFGVGFDVMAGLSFQVGDIGLNASVSAGVGPYGGSFVNAGWGIGAGIPIPGVKGLSASLGISGSTNFKTSSVGFSGGIHYNWAERTTGKGAYGKQGWGTGASINTGGGKPSMEIGGIESYVSNANANRISTHSTGFSIGIPVFYGINLQLGYSKVRYWTNETTGITCVGSYNNTGWETQGRAAPNGIAYDEYSLPEDPSFKNIVDYPDPTIVQGGSFPEYDVYNVNAQGLVGNIRPFLFEGALFNQNLLNGTTPLVTYYSPLPNNYLAYYRFDNDFSNRFMQHDSTGYTYPDPSLNLRFVVPPLDGSPVWGNNDGNYGGSQNSANLAGSKHVDVGPLIHPRNPLGYVRTGQFIEGFSITNESGVTYHFGLPAYSFNEENYQENLNPASGSAGNRTTRATAYAYTWYLTTITGPDFVDRNGDGIADEGDWGYWVDFEYGKWSNHYNWRNPAQGYQRDEDNQFQNCSMGTKEIYYLNAIRTRTHIALFEKGIRNDAKGESPSIFNKNIVNGISEGYQNTSGFDINSSQNLKLAHIYLLNASDSSFVTEHSGPSSTYMPTGTRNYPCNDCELAQNILDSVDVATVGRSALEAKAIRVIDFNYDYSLCPGTMNSYDINNPAVQSGKLTLNSVNFRGKGGSSNFPALLFGYELPTANMKTQTGVTVSPTQMSTTNGTFSQGDMIMSSVSPYTFYGVITAAPTLSGGIYTYPLANSRMGGGQVTANIQTTKNPPFNKDAYDSWGLYKSDINMTNVATNENLYRQTSVTSSNALDAWCLRTVTSQLGAQININYEADNYSGVVIPTNYPFVFTGLTTQSGTLSANNYYINFTLNNNLGYNIDDFFKNGGTGNIVLAPQYLSSACNNSNTFTIPLKTTYTITAIDYVHGIISATLATPIPETISYSSIPPWDGCFLQGTWNLSGTNNIGNVSPTNTALTKVYGGGIRVKSISTTDNSGVTYIASHNYNTPGSTITSGVTTYTPTVLDASAVGTNYLGGSTVDTSDFNNYRRVLYSKESNLYALARELPPPAVMYQYVTVTSQIQNPDEVANSPRAIEGSTLYQFEIPRSNMVWLDDITPRTGPISTSFGNMCSRNVALMKFTQSIGNLLRTVQYDALGNKLSETINHYLHENLVNLPPQQFFPYYTTQLAQYNDQGYLQERFSEVKEVSNQQNSANNNVFGGFFEKRTYPCIQTGQTVINYVNGTQTSSKNVAFDFYSGAVTEVVETDAYGNNLMTQTVPAYTKSQFANMGVKSYLDVYKNMLTQTAETYKWKVDANNTPLELVSATANTWSDLMTIYDQNGNTYVQNNAGGTTGDVWRMQSTYGWMPSNATVTTSDGLTPMASFVDFNWANPPASNANWKNTANVTRYDVFSKALESTDINGNYAATKMDYADNRITLSGGPAKYYEIAYSGAEDAAVNQTANMYVQAGNGTQTAAAAHTGTQSLLLGVSGQKGFVYTIPTANLTAGRTYQASVWVKPVSGSSSTVQMQYTVNGTVKSTSVASGSSTKTANGWYLVNLIVNGSDIVSGNTLSVYAINNDAAVQAYVDDFRFQPINAVTTAYVYDPFSGELDYVLDNSNIYTKYSYDGAGRLIGVYKEKLGVGVFQTSGYQYNYATYSSAAINQNYTVNNCGVSQQGTVVPISIPAGAYTSSVSQAAADAAAQIAAQNQANAQGYCTVINSVSVTNNASIAIVIKDGSGNTVYSGTFGVGSQNLPAIRVGTYSVNVIQTNGVSHNVSITGYSTQTGTNVTFSNVSFVTPVTISVW